MRGLGEIRRAGSVLKDKIFSFERAGGAGMEGSREINALSAPHVLVSARSLFFSLVALLVLVLSLPVPGLADEIDDLLGKRENGMKGVKRMKTEMTVTVERSGSGDLPASGRSMRYGMEVRRRSGAGGDSATPFDMTFEMLEPVQLKFKMEDGELYWMMSDGKWHKRTMSDDTRKFLDGLPDWHSRDTKGYRRNFEIRRLKERDNFWGTRKGLEYIPRGKTKMYSRRVDEVDVDTGQTLLSEHYDDTGKVKWRLKVNKLGKHNGVALPEETETESFTPQGVVKQRMKMNKVEIENE